MRYINQLAAVAVLALSLMGCANSGVTTTSSQTSTQQLYQSFVATPVAASILAQTGASLETACVIKPSSQLRTDVNTALLSISAALTAGNKVIQDAAAASPPADPSAASVGLNSAEAVLSTLQSQLAVLKVSPAAASRALAATHSKGASIATLAPVIINLVIQNLPLIISSVSSLAPIVEGWIDSLRGGTATTAPLTAADVQHAIDSLNGSLASWQNAGSTVCQ